MDRRRGDPSKGNTLPSDFLNLVSEVFTTNFDQTLKALSEQGKPARFVASGSMFLSEIVFRVSLLVEGQMAATTVYASCDFDPRASAPTVEELLGACVDASGAVFGQLLGKGDPKTLERVTDSSLGAFENIPFEWSALDIDKYRVFVKVDKSNPELDQMATDFLEKHDPEFKERLKEEEAETEKLFVTEPKKKPPVH